MRDINSLSRFSDEQVRVAYGNTLSDFALAEKYEHNAHLRPGIRARLDWLTKELERRGIPATPTEG